MKLMMFSKHLGSLSVADAGLEIKNLGLEGVDLTVRPGGHVNPEKVISELPLAVDSLKELGLEVPLITTNVTAADEQYATDVFDTAATLGINELKLGYWPYPGFGTIHATLKEVSKKLDGIEALATTTGVRANVHIHSNTVISALAPFVWELIRDRDPAAVGAYVDPGHMAVEGGVEGWRMGLDLLSHRTTMVAVKDMAWEQIEDQTLGKSRWVTKLVPLNRGVVPWPEVFSCLNQAGFNGWVSVHSEYQGGHSWRDLTLTDLLAQTHQDLEYLRWASEAGVEKLTQQ